MTGLVERFEEAEFPAAYGELVAETLSVHPGNYLAVKDTLHALRGLSDEQFSEAVASLNPGDQ